MTLSATVGIPKDDAPIRRQKFIDGLRFRAVAASVFIVAFWLLHRLGYANEDPLERVFALLIVLVLINGLYWMLGKAFAYPLSHFFAHWTIDELLISVILVRLGGVEVPYGFLAYVMIVVTSATFLSRTASYLVAVGATASSIMIAVLELSARVDYSPVWGTELDHATKLASVAFGVMFYFIFAYLVGTLADQLKAAQAQISEQNRKLENNVLSRTLELERRNSEIEEFVHVVTHDLRNVVVGAAELSRRLLTQDTGRLSPRGIRYATNLLEDTRRMTDMLGSLLAIFKVDEDLGRLAQVDTQTIISNVLTANAVRLETKQVRVSVSSMPTVLADESRLTHVLANLIDNALKYVGDKTDPHIRISGGAVPGGWEILVADNGVGIATDQCERIFQLYHRAPQQMVGGILQEGEGVGLAMCKRIVERWGGSITVRSILGEGSQFAVFIPAISPENPLS